MQRSNETTRGNKAKNSSVFIRPSLRAQFDYFLLAVRNNRRFCLLGHKNADGDSLGCMIAMGHYLQSLGKEVFIPYPLQMPHRYGFMEPLRNGMKATPDMSDTINIGFDVSSSSRLDLGENSESIAVDFIIDHHESDQPDRMSTIRETRYPAAGLIVYDFLSYVGANITEPIATALYTAILTDTGQFSFAGTDSRCLTVAADLVNKGASPAKISRYIYWNYPMQYMMNMKTAIEYMSFYLNDRVVVINMTNVLNSTNAANSNEGLINLGIMIEGVQVVVLLRKSNDDSNSIRASLRSREGINIADVARFFGGGGRINAAACDIKTDTETAINSLLNEIEKTLLRPMLA